MATYFTDDFTTPPGEFASDGSADWTARIRAITTSWSVSSGDLTIGAGATSDWTGYSWNELDADGDNDDVEILALLTSPSSIPSGAHVFSVRFGGADESVSNYSCQFRSTTLRTFYCNASDTPTQISTVNKTISTSTDWWMRFRVNGTTVKFKAWTGAIGDEPITGGAGDGWDVSATDSNVTGTGWVAVTNYSNVGSWIVKQLGVGTNGDTAPSSAPSSSTYTMSNATYTGLAATGVTPRVTVTVA